QPPRPNRFWRIPARRLLRLAPVKIGLASERPSTRCSDYQSSQSKLLFHGRSYTPKIGATSFSQDLVLELHSSISVERQMRTGRLPLCPHAPRLKPELWQIDLIFGKWPAALSLATFASMPRANSGIVKIISWKFSLTRRFLQMKS